ncbi:DUF262 domain-containing protein [Microbulbifer rhizosphaerae]|uniref:GmrSD restriction endonucleases N-terminal domain-containing protein n=1 Tax=Microbulbifer rhizosphaerae TaxID=1562603 RepID=A0A7W4ZA92_9GAMM|nr:DUF262 domain-containing protein [Microbulbifer rhizosphaerae]MBB3061094.1 hypothetical protein [Microbulbifer rhizosphaerae]
MSEISKVLVNEQDVCLDGADTSNDEAGITTPFDSSRIRVETKNTQMDTLIKRIKNDEIDLKTGFQRRSGIWSNKAQSRLIESMLINIPLPAFYMDATDDSRWLVVDGLQRLTTIRRFAIDEEFALTGLEFLSDYEGKKFSGLPRSFRRRIEETDIILHLIQPGTPLDVKFDIFRRINTGGEPLSAQEIRHALNQGAVTQWLETLAESDHFKMATDNGVASRRMDDRECVLRFLAFNLFSPKKYSADNFDQFLHAAMRAANEAEGVLEENAERFRRAMTTAREIFANDAFRKRYRENETRYPINKALFETWSLTLGALNEEDSGKLIAEREVVREKFRSLMNEDKTFEASISQGTGSVKKIQYRFARIEELVQGCLS